ncbi:hypothetical protein PI124_g14736 [Phytophthora idaei]|nr:hypothetical protein PI125_g13498 [Phytophthora idaei]KAG3147298.1 hypothetical protein PI126_g12934 [Phytophthora idaei]KAG3240357.1 hypothetical protein PI124_g14736 [Phytophthora idaei]
MGSRNFDVWKTRVTTSLDGKHLLGFVTKKDYNGVSEDEEDEDSSGSSEMSDVEASPKPATAAGYDSQAVDYEPSSDDDDPASEEGAKSGPATKPPSPIRPFTQRKSRRRVENEKPVPPSSRRLRRMEAQTKAFLMKTVDDTHIRLVKNLTSAYAIFQAICKKCAIK